MVKVEREKAILELLRADGRAMSMADIATCLGMEKDTIRVTLNRMYQRADSLVGRRKEWMKYHIGSPGQYQNVVNKQRYVWYVNEQE